MSVKQKLIDWWNGYTDKDIESLQQKIKNGRKESPGKLIHLTKEEHKALCAGYGEVPNEQS